MTGRKPAAYLPFYAKDGDDCLETEDGGHRIHKGDNYFIPADQVTVALPPVVLPTATTSYVLLNDSRTAVRADNSLYGWFAASLHGGWVWMNDDEVRAVYVRTLWEPDA